MNLASRIIGVFVFGLIGLLIGGGTGIVGGAIGARPGDFLFMAIGAIYGLSAGPDFYRLLLWLRKKRVK